MHFEPAAALAVVVTGALDFAGVVYLSRYGTHLVFPLTTRYLDRGFGDALEAGALPGFRVVALAKDRFLFRPVLWFEKEPSAAPLLVAAAVATVGASSVRVRIFAPLGTVLMSALIPIWFLRPMSGLTVIGSILVGAAVLACVLATFRAEFTACFDRLNRAWATAPENNKMQLTRSAHPGGGPRS